MRATDLVDPRVPLHAHNAALADVDPPLLFEALFRENDEFARLLLTSGSLADAREEVTVVGGKDDVGVGVEIHKTLGLVHGLSEVPDVPDWKRRA